MLPLPINIKEMLSHKHKILNSKFDSSDENGHDSDMKLASSHFESKQTLNKLCK